MAIAAMVRLTVPEEVFDQYDRQSPGKAHELMEKRLAETVSWPKLPLCIHDRERRQLDEILKQNCRDGAQFVKAVSRMSKVKIDKAEMQLDPVIIERLRDRCARNVKFEDYLTNLIREMLERYVGMR